MKQDQWKEFVECLDECVESMKEGISENELNTPDEWIVYVNEKFTFQMVKDFYIDEDKEGYTALTAQEVLSEIMFRKFEIQDTDHSYEFAAQNNDELVGSLLQESKSLDDFAEKVLGALLSEYVENVVVWTIQTTGLS